MTSKTFGRFTIVRKLAGGGMGRVFEAVDTAQGFRVALKLVDHGTDADSVEILAAERHGAILQKQLGSVDYRVAAVHELGDHEDAFYIVMEYVEGQDLSEVGRIGPLFAARIAQDVLEVLALAHGYRTSIEGRDYHGLVHGDIKPRNIRITTVGQVKLLDFGIAKALSLTRRFTQNQFGSVLYSSPERLRTGEVNVSSDLWSVGVVLYELVAGHPYFDGETGAQLDRAVRGYSAVRPMPENCPEALRAILTRALAPDVQDRFQTAEEFAEHLDAFRQGHLPPAGPVREDEATRRTPRTSGVAEEFEETRRTVATMEAPESDDQATRRTSGGAVGLAAPVKKPGRRVRLRIGRIFAAAMLALLLFGVYAVTREYGLWNESRQLAQDLEAERVQLNDDVWQRYRTLAGKAWMGMTLWPAQGALRDRLLASADRVILEYRGSDTPTVTQAEWQSARLAASRALELMPGDDNIRGRLRLIDGHLMRIRGSARREANTLAAARDQFEEAARLMSRSPDPYLGLARLYVYSMPDVDRAKEAIKQAERRGFKAGKRESAQLADGYRDRGDRMMKEAQRSVRIEEEERYLTLARDDYERARDLYNEIVPFGDAASELRTVADKLDAIELRRDRLKEAREDE
ncbi:MAG: serine/threonine-protein kinase [Bryobacteraceae bacterium]|nr:serine/threonine-protein kinase [Bryobacteraceae bacterium]